MNKKHIIIGGIVAAALIGAVQFVPTRVSNPQLYPNPQLTPGLVATSDYGELTALYGGKTYSQAHRMITGAMKKQVCANYPENCKGTPEVDHFIPIALGGADDVRNLWEQPEHVIVNGVDEGFHMKDKLEAYLVIQMKSKKITPSDAQNCIRQDWLACYRRFLGNKLGAVSNDPDL